jgi:hypothetical protein
LFPPMITGGSRKQRHETVQCPAAGISELEPSWHVFLHTATALGWGMHYNEHTEFAWSAPSDGAADSPQGLT